MGKFDSSLTRVQPVIGELLRTDPGGRSWLGKILQVASDGRPENATLPAELGDIVSKLDETFEFKVPPPANFLRWLLENPDRLSWPKSRGKPKQFGSETQRWRENLKGLHGREAQNNAQQQGLSQLNALGAGGSLRKWWAFEGLTTVDCRLETERALVFIEGKRTDSLAPSTEWFEGRNQLFRNLETCSEMANGKEFGVLLLAEDGGLQLTPQMVSEGLPHLQKNIRSDLMRHFWGCASWRDVCNATGLDYSKLPDRA